MCVGGQQGHDLVFGEGVGGACVWGVNMDLTSHSVRGVCVGGQQGPDLVFGEVPVGACVGGSTRT